MKIHELKLDLKYYYSVESGLKTFEIRKNDRGFTVGDTLALTAFHNGRYARVFGSNFVNDIPKHRNVSQQEATTIFFDVTYITNYEQKDGYVVMGIVPSRKFRQ